MLSCMRTTIRLHDELLRDAQRCAAGTDKTQTAVIENAPRLSLRRTPSRVSPPRRIALKTAGCGGLLPGIDLDNSVSLVDAVDRRT